MENERKAAVPGTVGAVVRRAPRWMPMNCYKCGRFIGPDGDPDVCEVDCGVYEAGYPTCGRCLKRDTSNGRRVSGGSGDTRSAAGNATGERPETRSEGTQ